jgi:hypothetical protein
LVVPIDKAAQGLAVSGFARSWVVQRIKEHLLAGGTFLNSGKMLTDDEPALLANGEQLYVHPRSEYRLATDQEVLDYADVAEHAAITGQTLSRRSASKAYVLRYHEDLARIVSYDELPSQAQIILDLLNEAGRPRLTEVSIAIILEEGKAKGRLVTRQEAMTVFGFYRHRLVEERHLELMESDNE